MGKYILSNSFKIYFKALIELLNKQFQKSIFKDKGKHNILKIYLNYH